MLEVLQEVTVVLERSESWNLTKLDIACPPLNTVCCVLGLKRMLRACGVHVALDGGAARPLRCLETNQLWRYQQNMPKHEERFDNYPIGLGAQSFNSAKLYWEVGVIGKEAWGLGIHRILVQKRGIFFSQS